VNEINQDTIFFRAVIVVIVLVALFFGTYSFIRGDASEGLITRGSLLTPAFSVAQNPLALQLQTGVDQKLAQQLYQQGITNIFASGSFSLSKTTIDSPITATFVNPQYIPLEKVPEYFTELKQLGINTIILHSLMSRSGNNCNEQQYTWYEGFPSGLKSYFSEAEENNIEVYIGTILGNLPEKDNCSSGILPYSGVVADELTKRTGLLVKDIKSQFELSDSFAGWYITDEPHLWLWSDTQAVQKGNSTFKGLVSVIREASNKPIMISSGLFGVQSSKSLTPQDGAIRVKNFIENTGVSKMIIYDGAGTIGQRNYLYPLSEYYNQIASFVGKDKIWAGLDLSACCSYSELYSRNSYRPTSLSRIIQQLKSIPSNLNLQKIFVSQDIYMTEIGYTRSMVESLRLKSQFISLFSQDSKIPKPISYTFATQISSDANSISRLFDGVIGNLFEEIKDNRLDTFIVAFPQNNKVQLTLDFGIKKRIDWVAIHLIQKETVFYPSSIEYLCSNDEERFITLGSWGKPRGSWQAPFADASGEYTFSNQTPLRAICQQVKIILTSDKNIALSEIEVSAD